MLSPVAVRAGQNPYFFLQGHSGRLESILGVLGHDCESPGGACPSNRVVLDTGDYYNCLGQPAAIRAEQGESPSGTVWSQKSKVALFLVAKKKTKLKIFVLPKTVPGRPHGVPAPSPPSLTPPWATLLHPLHHPHLGTILEVF